MRGVRIEDEQGTRMPESRTQLAAPRIALGGVAKVKPQKGTKGTKEFQKESPQQKSILGFLCLFVAKFQIGDQVRE